MTTDFELKDLDKDSAKSYTAMTFPVYRHLLSMQPLARHPEQGDQREVQPVAIGAHLAGKPEGLVLAEYPLHGSGQPEILSVFTQSNHRNKGMATAMIQRLIRLLGGRGFEELQAIYMTGKPSIPAMERVLAKCAFHEPEMRTLTVRFTPDEALSTPWFGRFKLPDHLYEIFPWHELSSKERAKIKSSHEASPWIADGLEPWKHDAHGFDQVSSLGVRYQGTVVGWVINHVISPGIVRFTCSFIHKNLSQRGRILPIFTDSIRRLRDKGCKNCTFITPVSYEPMISFIRRRCEPWVSFVEETRGTSRKLSS